EGGDIGRAFGSPPDGSPPEEDPNAPKAVFDQLAGMVPTVRFHVYRSTGRQIRVGGVLKPELEEQMAFGYFVLHGGDVYGWERIRGGDFETTDVPGLYHLKVPRNGKVVINTKVRGWDEKPPADRGPVIEPAPPQPGGEDNGGCLGIVLAFFAAVVALFKR